MIEAQGIVGGLPSQVLEAEIIGLGIMIRFAQTCETVAATTRKLEKTALVADYIQSIPAEEGAIAAIFFSGRPFAAFREETLQIGGAALWRAVAELSGKPEEALAASYRRHGDAGAVAAEVLSSQTGSDLSLHQVQSTFTQIANARGPTAKSVLLCGLLQQAS